MVSDEKVDAFDDICLTLCQIKTYEKPFNIMAGIGITQSHYCSQFWTH